MTSAVSGVVVERWTLSDKDIEQVEKLAAVLNLEQMADFFGVSLSTLYGEMQRNKIGHKAYKKGKSKAIAFVATSLLSEARKGNLTAQIFYLKTQARWRERHEVVVEIPQMAKTDHLSQDDAAALYKQKVLEKM